MTQEVAGFVDILVAVVDIVIYLEYISNLKKILNYSGVKRR